MRARAGCLLNAFQQEMSMPRSRRRFPWPHVFALGQRCACASSKDKQQRRRPTNDDRLIKAPASTAFAFLIFPAFFAFAMHRE